MQKISTALLLCSGVAVAMASARTVGLFSVPAIAQEEALGKPPEMLVDAAQTYGVERRDVSPWRLQVEFQTFDDSGKPLDKGSYEEVWKSANANKREYISSSFSQTRYQTENGVFVTGSSQTVPFSLSLLIHTIVNPMIGPDGLRHFAANPESAIVAIDREDGGVALRCFRLLVRQQNGSQPDPRFGSEYCFAADGTLARDSSDPPTFGEATIPHSIPYDGHLIPGDLSIKRGNVSVVSAHIDGIEALGSSDEAELQPPPDARPWTLFPPPGQIGGVEGAPSPGPNPPAEMTQRSRVLATPPSKINISAGVAVGMIVSNVDPVYPAEALAAHVSGTVVLLATIDTAGVVEELRVISGPAMLQQAALDAVKHWRYRPYLLNNEPISVVTTVNVVFTMAE
jgi:TonB family protein